MIKVDFPSDLVVSWLPDGSVSELKRRRFYTISSLVPHLEAERFVSVEELEPELDGRRLPTTNGCRVVLRQMSQLSLVTAIRRSDLGDPVASVLDLYENGRDPA